MKSEARSVLRRILVIMLATCCVFTSSLSAVLDQVLTGMSGIWAETERASGLDMNKPYYNGHFQTHYRCAVPPNRVFCTQTALKLQ